MKYTNYSLVVSWLWLAACHSPPATLVQPVDSTINYLIKAGNHYCQQSRLEYTTKSKLVFLATFNESATYKTADPAKQSDINKLYGFSDCNSSHQTNSARFGWNWYNDSLRIYAYYYRSGVMYSQPMGIAQVNQTNLYKIQIQSGQYIFSFNDNQYIATRGCTDTTTLERYQLYPYFGGTEVAPHDITITIQEL